MVVLHALTQLREGLAGTATYKVETVALQYLAAATAIALAPPVLADSVDPIPGKWCFCRGA